MIEASIQSVKARIDCAAARAEALDRPCDAYFPACGAHWT